MTYNIYLLVLTMKLLILGVSCQVNHAQSNCKNSVYMIVKKNIMFNTGDCVMVNLPEMRPATSCIEVTHSMSGDAVAVQGRDATNWCCVFQGGQVRVFLFTSRGV